MSTTHDLVAAMKAELKAAGITMPNWPCTWAWPNPASSASLRRRTCALSVDEVLRVLKLDFADLARKVADSQPLRRELTHEQEAAVIADRKLLLMAICAFSQWTFEQIVAPHHTISEAECGAAT